MICNDVYAKGLREIRAKAHVIYFNKLSQSILLERLS